MSSPSTSRELPVANDISDYLTSLKGCSLLDKLELPYIQVTTVDQVELRKFEIQANIAANADACATSPAAVAEANAKLQKQQILTTPTGNTRMTISPSNTITNAEPAKPDLNASHPLGPGPGRRHTP